MLARSNDMPIPSSRQELLDQVTESYENLRRDIREGGPEIAGVVCVDDWTVRELLAVRAWWTERVVDWIEAGRRGETPELPASGYGWHQTPELNAEIAQRSEGQTYNGLLERLDHGFEEVLRVIASLDDRELLEPNVFGWAGKWPVSRWISINTARQYRTARTYVRRALPR